MLARHGRRWPTHRRLGRWSLTLRRELEAAPDQRDRLVADTAALRELVRRKQEIHRATQRQVDRLLPAPDDDDGDRRPWWRRVMGR